MAIGMTFVILTAGIDLSIGSLLAFAGLVAAAVAKGGLQDRFTVGEGGLGYGWELAALAAIAVGLIGGYLQGLAITRLKVPPFVVTLGGMSAAFPRRSRCCSPRAARYRVSNRRIPGGGRARSGRCRCR